LSTSIITAGSRPALTPGRPLAEFVNLDRWDGPADDLLAAI
jgi:hypothetical protein